MRRLIFRQMELSYLDELLIDLVSSMTGRMCISRLGSVVARVPAQSVLSVR